MEKYKIRKGTVLLDIHGAYLLAADEEARKHCIYAKELNETGALIWKGLESGMDERELTEQFRNEFEIEDESALMKDIEEFEEELYKAGYLYRPEEEL